MLCSTCFLEVLGSRPLDFEVTCTRDNSGAEAVCNKLYTSKTPLNLFVCKLCMWSALLDILLECSHIVGEKNDDADFLSRWNGNASTLSSRFRSKDQFPADLPAFWNVTFSVSLFPPDAKLLWKLSAWALLLQSQKNSSSSTSTRFLYWAVPRCCKFRLASFQPGLFVTAAAWAF